MATRFELVLQGEDKVHLRAAGEEAIREIQRIAARFSFYNPTSELSRINREAAARPVRVSGEMFALLMLCQNVYIESGGAFDPSVGPLMNAWGFSNGQGAVPDPERVACTLDATGFEKVKLDGPSSSVQFACKGIQLDLGGVAKGWALDECALLLKDSGITSALLHGGTSSVLAIGEQDHEKAWTIGIEDPYESGDKSRAWFTECDLCDGSLSVSAIHGKSFVEGSKEYGHIIDPRSGFAISGPLVSCVLTPSAALADAWSTVYLVRSEPILKTGPAAGASFEKSGDEWLLRSGAWPGFA